MLSLSKLLRRGVVVASSQQATVVTARAFSAAAPVPASLVKQLREMTNAPMMDCKKALEAEGGNIEKAVDWLRKKGVAAASKKSARTASQGLVTVAVNEAGDAGAVVELNSETDFVARNTTFQTLAAAVTQTALTALPPVAAGNADAASGTDVAPLAAAPLAGSTVAAAVTDLIAKVGENCVLRRGAKLSAPGGMVCAYTHNAVCRGAGNIGVLIAMAPKDGKSQLSPAHPAWAPLQELGKRLAMHVAAAKPSYLSKEVVPTAALDRERVILKEQAIASGKEAKFIDKMVEGRISKYYADVCLLEQPFILSEDGTKVAKLVEQASTKAGVPVRVVDFLHFVVGGAPAPAPAAPAAGAQ